MHRRKSKRNGNRRGRRRISFAPAVMKPDRNITCWRCSPSRRGASIWVMCATIRWATLWRATSCRRGITCCTRWAGMPSACPPRMRRWRAVVIPRTGPMPISPPCATRCGPEYYGQQQALFLDFLEKGLVYRKNAVVNWDPVDMTVLANEQVIDGKGWRSGAEVERRELTQWFFRISDFSEELLEALDGLDDWPAKVRTMQENWIGKSRGLQFAFGLNDGPDGHDRVEVYTTRPDTLMGASFIGISPDHPLARQLEREREDVAAFCAEARKGGTTAEAIEKAEKLGFDTGLTCRHPFDTAWELPVYIANFILMDYGTGAIFGCPGHDQRDHDFARKFGLPIIDTFLPMDAEHDVTVSPYIPPKPERVRYTRPVAGSAEQTGEVAIEAAIAFCEENGVGQGVTKFRLRDWGLSRQRYWGCPIPVVHCDACGVVPEKKANLPVQLPYDEGGTPIDFSIPGNPLDRHPTWRDCACPACGAPARRETDTMDTFVDSSWYYARFTAPRTTTPT